MPTIESCCPDAGLPRFLIAANFNSRTISCFAADSVALSSLIVGGGGGRSRFNVSMDNSIICFAPLNASYKKKYT